MAGGQLCKLCGVVGGGIYVCGIYGVYGVYSVSSVSSVYHSCDDGVYA